MGPATWTGYGVDSLIVALAAICRMQYFSARLEQLEEIYPTAHQARVVTAVLQAARIVRDLNFKYLQSGQGAPVTARFGPEGLTIVDPIHGAAELADLFQRVYTKPI